jgi:subtilisin family serine protease
VAPDLVEEARKGSPSRTVRLVATLEGADADGLAREIARLGGRVRGNFRHAGAMAFEAPLDAVEALAATPGVRYIAPDREVSALASQVGMTTGADLVYPGMLSLAGDAETVVASPVVVDARSSAAGPGTNGTTLAWPHTIGSGPDRFLVVGVSLRDGNTSVTGVTYGGAALTRIGFQNAGGSQNRTEMWELPAPATGTADVVVTLSAAKKLVGGAVSFFHVDPTAPHGPFVSAIGSTKTASVTVPSGRGQLVVDTVSTNGDANSLTESAEQAAQWDTFSGKGDAGNARGGGSLETGASYVTMSWALGAGKPWSAGAVSLKPAGAPAFGGFDGTGVTVAVIDSGIAPQHQDLIRGGTTESRVVLGVDFTGKGKTDDLFGHGTHVAGIIAGDGGASHAFGRDYMGIAPGATLVNLRVLDDFGHGYVSSIVAAIDRAIAVRTLYNIRVINLSLAAPPIDSYVDDPICQAVARATSAGIVVVASAGNFGQDPTSGEEAYGSITSPGNSPAAITVGAVDGRGTAPRSDDQIARFSSRGPTLSHSIDPVTGAAVPDLLAKPDLVAPGGRMVSLERDDNYLVKTYKELDVDGSKPNARYMMLSGTSMSAAVVSGAAALMLQANPSLTPNMVKAILMYSAQMMDGPDLFEQGAGLLNIEGAVRLAATLRQDAGTLPVGSTLADLPLPQPVSTISGETVAWSQGLIWGFGGLQGMAMLTTRQEAYSQSLIWGLGRLDAWGAGVTYYDGLYSQNYVAYGQDNEWCGVTWDSGTSTSSGLIWTRPMDASGPIWTNRVISSDFFDPSSSSLIWGINNYDAGLIWGGF